MHLPMHPSTQPRSHPCIHPPTYSSIHLSIHLPSRPPTLNPLIYSPNVYKAPRISQALEIGEGTTKALTLVKLPFQLGKQGPHGNNGTPMGPGRGLHRGSAPAETGQRLGKGVCQVPSLRQSGLEAPLGCGQRTFLAGAASSFSDSASRLSFLLEDSRRRFSGDGGAAAVLLGSFS